MPTCMWARPSSIARKLRSWPESRSWWVSVTMENLLLRATSLEWEQRSDKQANR